MQVDHSVKKCYQSILGPSRTREILWGPENAHDILNEGFRKRYKEINDPISQLAYENSMKQPMFKVCNFPCPGTTIDIMQTYPDDNNTYVLITAPRETQINRLVAQYASSDPRLSGKSNYMYLIRHEIEKELDARQHFVDQLESTVDYHIHNDGELNQYYAAIDQVLNEENLLT